MVVDIESIILRHKTITYFLVCTNMSLRGKSIGQVQIIVEDYTIEGMDRLRDAKRLIAGNGLYYKRYLADFPVRPMTDSWTDTGGAEDSLTKKFM